MPFHRPSFLHRARGSQGAYDNAVHEDPAQNIQGGLPGQHYHISRDLYRAIIDYFQQAPAYAEPIVTVDTGEIINVAPDSPTNPHDIVMEFVPNTIPWPYVIEDVAGDVVDVPDAPSDGTGGGTTSPIWANTLILCDWQTVKHTEIAEDEFGFPIGNPYVYWTTLDSYNKAWDDKSSNYSFCTTQDSASDLDTANTDFTVDGKSTMIVGAFDASRNFWPRPQIGHYSSDTTYTKCYGKFTAEIFLMVLDGDSNGTDPFDIALFGQTESIEVFLNFVDSGFTHSALYYKNDGVSVNTILDTFATTPNEYHHVCLERDTDNYLRVYVDGEFVFKQLWTVAVSASIIVRADGYGPVRFTKGVVRYGSGDANFTPPTSFEVGQ